MGVFKIKIGRIALFATALFAVPAMATTYWLDNSVAESGDGTTKETAFKSWNEAWAALGALENTAKAELNVVASATPYYVTNATPAALKGVTTLAALRGVNADGTDVASPASVVVDGNHLYQIAPLGERACFVTVSGITFRNGLGTGASSNRNSLGGPAALWAWYSGSATYAANYNTVSNCVFEGCSGGTALVFVGQSNRVENCVFRNNTTDSGVNSLLLCTKYNTHVHTNRVIGCVFEDNGSAENATCAAALLYLAEVKGCTFARNESDNSNGVALRLEYCASTTSGGQGAVVQDCTFAANTNHYNGSQSTGSYNGAIMTAANGSSVEMGGCVFSNNVATATYCGAGFEARNQTGPHVLRDCVFHGNVAKFGGTVAMIDMGNSANNPNRITLENCILRGNDGPLLYGGHYSGGIWTLDGCTIASNRNCTAISNCKTTSSQYQFMTTNVVRNCTFDGNAFGSSSSSDGRVRSGFVLAVTEFDRCVFKGNSNNYRALSSFGSLSVTNSLFVGNTGTSGYFIYPETGELHVANCTIVGNANKQAFLYKPTSTSSWSGDTVVNCILSGNTVAQNGQFQSGSEGCYSYCFTDFEIAGAGAGMVGGTAGANPGFANTAAGDYTLAKNSVCRNAGDSSVWAGIASAKDLAGNGRINAADGNVVDIGCYEWYSSAPPGLMIFVR